MLFFSIIVLFSCSLLAMEAPHESYARRPIEESFFELHAQTNQRLKQVDERIEEVEARQNPLHEAVDSGVEKVKRATGDAQLQCMILHNEMNVATFAREQQGYNGAIKARLEALQTNLSEQNRKQEAEQERIQGELRQLRADNAQLVAQLEEQRNLTKTMCIVGGAVVVVGAVTLLGIKSKLEQHDGDLYGYQESQDKNKSLLNRLVGSFKGTLDQVKNTQDEIKGLKNQVSALQSRPYVSKDDHNHLVYHSSTGSDPVKGAHVSHW